MYLFFIFLLFDGDLFFGMASPASYNFICTRPFVIGRQGIEGEFSACSLLQVQQGLQVVVLLSIVALWPDGWFS